MIIFWDGEVWVMDNPNDDVDFFITDWPFDEHTAYPPNKETWLLWNHPSTADLPICCMCNE